MQRKIGDDIFAAYQSALAGIRATERGQQPIKPSDSYLLHDVSLILMDCALRPEECYRLQWEQIRESCLHVDHGKTPNARRAIPLTTRSQEVLRYSRECSNSSWVFPAATQSGHIEQSTLRDQHRKACALTEISYFPFYTFRHSCLTKWSQHMDPYTLAYFAGHTDFGTTRRYVHPSLESGRAAMERANMAWGRHSSGHTAPTDISTTKEITPLVQ